MEGDDPHRRGDELPREGEVALDDEYRAAYFPYRSPAVRWPPCSVTFSAGRILSQVGSRGLTRQGIGDGSRLREGCLEAMSISTKCWQNVVEAHGGRYSIQTAHQRSGHALCLCCASVISGMSSPAAQPSCHPRSSRPVGARYRGGDPGEGFVVGRGRLGMATQTIIRCSIAASKRASHFRVGQGPRAPTTQYEWLSLPIWLPDFEGWGLPATRKRPRMMGICRLR